MPPTAVDQRHARVTKKSKKQREEDDFEKLLSALNKATQSATPREPTKKAAPRGRDPRNLWSNNEPPMANKGDGLSSMQARMTQSEREFNAGMEMIQRLLRERAMIPRSFLDAPNTEFRGSTTKRNKHFNVGVGEMQGWRAHMEDVHLIDVQFPFDGQVESKEGLFCVFDGHAGKDCAMKCGELFPKVLRKHTKVQPDGFHSVDFDTAFLEVDEQLRRASIKGGCTAVAVHVTPIGVHCSSVGDSRAVLCRDGAAFDLSNDHKPELEEETDRILAAGGTVSDNRVNGSLAMSRAMGDFTFKEVKGKGIREQLVIAVPDVISATREPTDTFVVLACDGIFDVLSNEELIAFVVEKKGLGLDNKEICQLVCDHCISPVSSETGQPVRVKGTDNMTIMIVDLLM